MTKKKKSCLLGLRYCQPKCLRLPCRVKIQKKLLLVRKITCLKPLEKLLTVHKLAKSRRWCSMQISVTRTLLATMTQLKPTSTQTQFLEQVVVDNPNLEPTSTKTSKTATTLVSKIEKTRKFWTILLTTNFL